MTCQVFRNTYVLFLTPTTSMMLIELLHVLPHHSLLTLLIHLPCISYPNIISPYYEFKPAKNNERRCSPRNVTCSSSFFNPHPYSPYSNIPFRKKLVLQIPLKLFMLGVIYLAMEKDDLIKEIKQREEELDREKLLRQIQLKENELQRLLSGIDQKEFLVPGNGIWKIQSQKLDGKSIPKAEWIVPQMSPDFRYTISV